MDGAVSFLPQIGTSGWGWRPLQPQQPQQQRHRRRCCRLAVRAIAQPVQRMRVTAKQTRFEVEDREESAAGDRQPIQRTRADRDSRTDEEVVEEFDALKPYAECSEQFIQLYVELFRALGRLGEVDRTESEWRTIGDKCIKYDARICSGVLAVLCHNRSYEQLQPFLDEMLANGFRYEVSVLRMLVDCCLRDGNVIQAADCLLLAYSHKPVIDRSLIGRIFNQLFRRKKIEKALSLLRSLQQEGFEPDSALANSLLNCTRQQKRVDLAWKALKEIEQFPSEIAIDNITGNLLVAHLAKGMPLQEMQQYKERLEKTGFKCGELGYTALVSAATKAGDLDRALTLYGEILSRGMKPSHEIFVSVINACGKFGALEKAFDIHEHMALCDMKPSTSTFNALINGCRIAGDVERLREVIDTMEYMEVSLDVVTYSSLVDAYGKIGRVEDAFATVDRMIANGVEPSLVTFTHLINAAVRAGHIDAAYKVFELIKQRNMRPNVFTYTTLINGLAKRGEIERALSVLEQMRATDVRPTIVTYSTLLKVCTRLYGSRLVEDVVRLMEDDLKYFDRSSLEQVHVLYGHYSLPFSCEAVEMIEQVLAES
mmetsp:Transcript_8108/g.24440  ORF Transcript_8108/g.24440 Transcript_8108/m.24440 type:complete len:598 (+) Transcript_8108:111-1904(+)